MSEVAWSITPTTGAAIASAAARRMSSPPADDAVDAGLDQTVDAVEVGSSIAVAIRTGNEIDHCACLLLAVSPVW